MVESMRANAVPLNGCFIAQLWIYINLPAQNTKEGRWGELHNTSQWVVNGMGACPVNNSTDGHSLTAHNIPKVNKCGMVFADKLM